MPAAHRLICAVGKNIIMKKSISIIFLLIPLFMLAQRPGKYSKPNDFSYYTLSLGAINSPSNDAFQTSDVWSGKFYALYGEARISSLEVLYETSPKNRFHIRDIIELQLGVGYGTDFYANIGFAGGLKFKYDINQNMDFGVNVTGRLALDHMSYYGIMAQPFARYKWVMVQYGIGENNADNVTDSKERKFNHLNTKFFFKPDDPNSKYINFNYWHIQARNNQVTNPWEGNTQLMIGFGWQLGS